MSLKKISHNKEAINQLISFIEMQNISGSFLFYGANSLILKAFAKKFAKALNCINKQYGCDQCIHCLEIEKEIFPDIYRFQARNGIELLRKLINEISMSSHEKAKKIIFIEKANELTLIEANLLLKTVEEPPRDTYFIFISTTKQVLPTIFSRCIPIKFKPIQEKEVEMTTENFHVLNGEISVLSIENFCFELPCRYQDIPELLEQSCDTIEWQFSLNTAIEDYLKKRNSISKIEQFEWIFKIEKSLNKNRVLLSYFLSQFLYKVKDSQHLEKMIYLKNGVRFNLTIKLVLLRFFEYL